MYLEFRTDKQPLYTESPLFSPFLTYQLCADQHKYGCEFLNFIGISASKTALYKLQEIKTILIVPIIQLEDLKVNFGLLTLKE